jgi:hypothetical protein
MGMSTYVIGIKPPDEKWHAMKKIWDACQEAKISPPEKVAEFFDSYYGDGPDPKGVLVRLDLCKPPCVSEYRDEMSEGIEIDVRKLPPDVTIVRFVNSW